MPIQNSASCPDEETRAGAKERDKKVFSDVTAGKKVGKGYSDRGRWWQELTVDQT